MQMTSSEQSAICCCGAGKNGGKVKGKNRMKGVFQNKKTSDWYIDYRTSDGKRRRETIGPSRQLAENVLRKRKVEMAEGKYLDKAKQEKIKFEDFCQEYFNMHSKPHKKSWQMDYFHLEELKRFFKGQYLYAITTSDIEKFKVERLKKVSSSTVNRQLGVLRSMFNKAIAWGKLDKSPMRSVEFLKEPKGRLRFLEREEIAKLFSNCSRKLRPVVTVAIFTGMRRGEIFRLKWHDIDVRRNIITLLDTKNGDKREVPMNEQVKTALIRVPKHPESPYVFCNEEGQPLHDIRKSFWTALRKAGIKDFRWHDLRHTFASQLVMSGIDLNTVRELLGHKDITMTLRYSHLSPSYKHRAVEILGRRMDSFWTLEQKAEIQGKAAVSQPIDNKVFV
jgi:integrase